MLPLTPGRFSITTAWPSAPPSRSPINRAKISVDPPGANGTTIRIGLAGYRSWPFATGLNSRQLAMTRIKRITQSIPEKVERKHQKENRQARPDRHPGRVVDVVLGGVQHAAPARRGRLLAEAEEGEARLGDDRGGDGEGGLDDERRDHVRQDVAQRDAQVRIAERARGFDVVLDLDRQHLAARQADEDRRR